MGHRTLSLGLVLRALFLDSEAFDELRDDDNPFIEGLYLIVLIGLATALLSLIGQILAWASVPRVEVIRGIVLDALQQQPWWPALAASPESLEAFQRTWDTAWRIFPRLFGAPDPATAALNLLAWPVLLVLSWLLYGVLAFAFSTWLGGRGTFRETLGTVALAFSPVLLRGLGFVPFLVVGGVINTWQLILRYKAVRSAHGLPWGRAVVATLLPYAVYLAVWLLMSAVLAVIVSALVGR